MTVQDDMNRRIKEARAEKSVSGRMLAIIIEGAMSKMTKEELSKEIENA